MSSLTSPSKPSEPTNGLPKGLREQLIGFRSYVRRSKMLEVLGLALSGVLIGFLVVFLTDRWFDTSRPIRFAIGVSVIAVWLLLPWAFHRWVWSYRKFDQLANLIRKRAPSLGDELLGVIELSENRTEQQRSPALCAAAIQQVASRTAKRNLLDFAPRSRHTLGLRVAAGLTACALLMLVIFPSAAWNTVKRLSMPWRSFERFTFAQLERLPSRIVVPHGEAFNIEPTLTAATRWSPEQAVAKIAYQPLYRINRVENRYPMSFEAMNGPADLDLRIGDYTHRMTIEPKLRPELSRLQASVQLPAYLQIQRSADRDIRGGSLSVVAGSSILITADVNRDLASANWVREGEFNTKDTKVITVGYSTPKSMFGEPLKVEEGLSYLSLQWTDKDGLTAKQPFRIAIEGTPDQAPLVSVEGLPRNTIVLNTEQLNFQIVANDDFGVREVGLEWSVPQASIGNDEPVSAETPSSATSSDRDDTKATGSRLLASGEPERTSLLSQGTFRPIDWGIESQPIELKAWSVDYMPGRERSRSAAYRLLVLRPDEHAIWVTEQLNQWHRQSLDVRDRELQLYAANRELRDLPSEALGMPENRKKLEEQASAEAANERRLRSLVGSGEALLRQAARNPEFGVGHLERWAEMLKVLQGIGHERMPKVADLLRKAGQEAAGSNASAKPSGPAAGMIRDTNSAASSSPPPTDDPSQAQPMPKLVDRESSMENPKQASPSDASPPKQGGGGKFTLPQTTLMGPAQKPGDAEPEPPEENKVEAAVKEQAELLAEFDRLADALGEILGDLEGSTLVKRLKAASRDQLRIAQEMTKRLEILLSQQKYPYSIESNEAVRDLAEAEEAGSLKVSNIMDDLEAYQERRRLTKFQKTFDEMKETQVVGALRRLGEDIPKEHGMSIAQAEYWADTLDRWAEDLVDPAGKGNCPGCKNNDSLPPSVVLEVLQILEGQVDLREETRVVEQARRPELIDEHRQAAGILAARQQALDERVLAVNDKIKSLPDGGKRFPDEVQRLDRAGLLMTESTELFNEPETGKPSIAIQTEIIELLLESKRINPKAGGGGGATPGGGGQGDTTDAALALIGAALDWKGKTEERETTQATGTTGSTFPEEFRDGLNRYFQLLESRSKP